MNGSGVGYCRFLFVGEVQTQRRPEKNNGYINEYVYYRLIVQYAEKMILTSKQGTLEV